MTDILSALIAGLLANLLFPAVDRIVKRWRRAPAEAEAPKYSQRLAELTETLRETLNKSAVMLWKTPLEAILCS